MSKFFVLILFSFLIFNPAICENIKEADLSGTWYLADSRKLYKKINSYLRSVKVQGIEGEVIAIISPHAGIIFSGEVAAHSFEPLREKGIKTVVLVGFSHRKDYDGIAVFDKDGIRTPLGVLYSDKALIKKITAVHEKIFTYLPAFSQENSVELILPFIQVALNSPKVLLLAIGRQSLENCQILGEALYQILKNKDNFLIIASTDMSHYLPDFEARNIDSKTAEIITQMQPKELFLRCYLKNRMCGLAAVTATMIAAKKLGAEKARILKMDTSANVRGDKASVVGYLSAAFIRDKPIKEKERVKMREFLTPKQRKELLKIARDTVNSYVKQKKVLDVETNDSILKETMGVFVTLHKDGQLRGCIGNIIGREPLYLGVRNMAIAAAAQDPRFSPVRFHELDDIEIEVSVLTPLRRISDSDEIILGTHGVLVRDGFRSGVYLPQVATETGWSKEEFMNSLCSQKARMEPDAWKTGKCEIHVFTAEVFGE